MAKASSIWSEMRHNIISHTRDGRGSVAKASRKNALRAHDNFKSWAQSCGYTSRDVRADRRGKVEEWLAAIGGRYAQSTLHTMAAGVCMGLKIPMDGLARHGTVKDKRKSRGEAERSQKARLSEANEYIVAFQLAVGGRRAALQRLTGADYVYDETTGNMAVRFARDKGGKDQLQVIAPADEPLVRSYFARVGREERLFATAIDNNLDLHGMRAEHARKEYQRYREIAATPDGRERLSESLRLRYTDKRYGNKGYRLSADAAAKKEMVDKWLREEASDEPYILRGDNRTYALEHGLPTRYDRLALCCVSVFALSHWRNDVTVKHYML